ncbi:MAG: ATP-binding protein [Verrucomicrobia bacterium]|nr:ATP-binding protein [Verrucomicrobiota bacterium]
MKLARLRIRNFRCYKKEFRFDFDDMTAFVGKNDVGKSSVMDALDIFLNEGAPDKHDATKDGEGKDLTIICEFTGLPLSVIIDEDNPTSFQAEYLLNADGRLEIHKTFSGHLATPKCTSVTAFALHPTADDVADLVQLKNPELKKRAEKLKVNLSGVDPKVNAQLRQRIRESVGDLKLKTVFVPLNEDKTNKPWDRIKAYVPLLALFKSDRASTDQDPEAQDPLKTAVKEAIKQREVELNAIASHVETEVRRIAKATLEKLKEMDESLAQQLNPQITLKKWETLFNVSITGDEDIPINKRGSGVKRLVLLNFFRAKAEQQAREKNDAPVIYAIEEPETSQHPHNQRLLVSALLDLATDSQVILTTHTPMLARTLPDTYLRYIHLKPDKTREVLQGGGETNALFAKSLGVLPDNAIKLFIGVEGRHDIAFLKNMARVLRQAGCDVFDLEKMELDSELIFFPLGGSSLALWTSRLEPLSRPEFHLFDRDEPPPTAAKYQAEADAINARARCKAVITGKKEMENYLHFEAINEAYASVCNIALGLVANFAEFDDVPAKIAEMVHAATGSPTAWAALAEDVKEKKISNVKRNLNEHAAVLMTKGRLDQVDPDGHVLSWFTDMKTLAEV